MLRSSFHLIFNFYIYFFTIHSRIVQISLKLSNFFIVFFLHFNNFKLQFFYLFFLFINYIILLWFLFFILFQLKLNNLFVLFIIRRVGLYRIVIVGAPYAIKKNFPFVVLLKTLDLHLNLVLKLLLIFRSPLNAVHFLHFIF